MTRRQAQPSAALSPEATASPPSGPREPDDDFFCLRFQVWYNSFDCAVRTRFRTCPGCLHCPQGRFNARRHASRLAALRLRLPLAT